MIGRPDPGSIPDHLTGKAREAAEAIVALLRERGALGDCYIGDNRSDETSAWFTVYWEGTDAAPFFNLDYCIPPGKWSGTTEDYEPHTTMMELCATFGCFPENSWAASPVYGV
jgi:hypothetical protein